LSRQEDAFLTRGHEVDKLSTLWYGVFMANLYDRAKITKKLYDSGLTLFTTSALKGFLGVEKKNTFLKIIRRLCYDGILLKLERGKYTLVGSQANDFELANFLYRPSYISLETALNLSGVLSQFPYEITSVTSKKSREKMVEGKVFAYLHIKPSLFWGYQKKGKLLIAEPEKAILDSAYFVSKGLRGLGLEELNWTLLDKNKLLNYGKKFPPTVQFEKYFGLIKRRIR